MIDREDRTEDTKEEIAIMNTPAWRMTMLILIGLVGLPLGAALALAPGPGGGIITTEAELEPAEAEELARRERQRMSSRGIVSYQLSEDGTRVLVPLSGRLFKVDLATKIGVMVSELKGAAGHPIDPRMSRDGTKVACVRDGDLYVFDLPEGTERRLTTGAGGSVSHGTAEFAAQVMQSPFFEIAKRRDTQSQTNYGPALFGAAAMQREAILSDRAGVFTTSVAAPS